MGIYTQLINTPNTDTTFLTNYLAPPILSDNQCLTRMECLQILYSHIHCDGLFTHYTHHYPLPL